MKKLVILSKESIFSGYVKCGMAEVADSLANALTDTYEVSLIVAEGNCYIPNLTGLLKEKEPGILEMKFAKVQYYIVNTNVWEEKVIQLMEQIKPDIFHNLDDPSIISKLLTRPAKTVFTFDSIEFAEQHQEYLPLYDNVVSNSKTLASSMMRRRSVFSNTLMQTNFSGVTPGIVTQYFTPEKGLLIPAAYQKGGYLGKEICKQHLLDTYGIKDKPFVCLTMCRLVKEKGLDFVIDAIETIGALGGILIVVGVGDSYYQDAFTALEKQYSHVIYINQYASTLRIPPFIAGADFYLQPSLMETAGLMPMTALAYGTIPIISIVGGLYDTFNSENCIEVYDNDVKAAITRAANLYQDKKEFRKMRNVCMSQDISWITRKQDYINLYEQ